jgi:hypothetical protein
MIRLIRKELRENFRWAVLVFVVGMVVIFLRRAPDLAGPLSGAVLRRAAVFYPTRDLVFESGAVGLPLLWPTTWMALLCGAWGLGLGVAQTLPESVRDTWQVLFTLPVIRLRAFIAKVGAGLALYLAGVGVPYAFVVWRAATPGQYPSPFRWWMLGPGVAAIASGLCLYGAGMLSVLRPARWYGSRAIPALAAAGVLFYARNFGWMGAGCAAVVAAVFLWAAAAMFHRRDF